MNEKGPCLFSPLPSLPPLLRFCAVLKGNAGPCSLGVPGVGQQRREEQEEVGTQGKAEGLGCVREEG